MNRQDLYQIIKLIFGLGFLWAVYRILYWLEIIVIKLHEISITP